MWHDFCITYAVDGWDKLMKKILMLSVMFCMAISSWNLQASERNDRARGVNELPAIDPASQKLNRLRFRNGPVCMCSQGMSEADIQQAEQRRRIRRRAE